MKTVSLELAKRLKSAGLEWKPKRGDWFNAPIFNVDIFCLVTTFGEFDVKENHIWLPSLSDLLEVLEKICTVDLHELSVKWRTAEDSWEDAAAKTLLWALGQANVLPST